MYPKNLFTWLSYTIAFFLTGSIMFCQMIPQRVLHIDICAMSKDHNPGASNVFSNCGAFWGTICLSLDIMKGFVPIFLSLRYLEPGNMLFSMVLAAPVLGHAVAPLNHFHGGKCIATAFGEMLALYPMNRVGILLAAFYILFSTVIRIPSHRIRSIASFGVFGASSGLILTYQRQYSIALGCVLICLIAIAKHSKYFCCQQ